jgi:hypothetical protein
MKRKNFFFEKKKQKTFAHCVPHAVQKGQRRAVRNRQKFFGPFFQERTACFLTPAQTAPDPPAAAAP